MAKSKHDEPTLFAAITTYMNYLVMFIFGYLREFFRGFLSAKPQKGYALLVKGYEDFYTRRFYGRMEDCWNRPITGTPGAWIDVLERVRVKDNLVLTGEKRKCLNLGSYNYLGFADQNMKCRSEVKEAMKQYGVVTCSPVVASGQTSLHRDLEREVADFLGKAAAIVTPMGFATNSTVLPAIVGKGDLIISDSLNHASIVVGARSSGAKIKVFEHNNPKSLAKVLQTSIREGQPRIGQSWKKILVIVEGIYSMEGEIVRLKEIVQVCKRHKAYLWLDEAHSIGCMGATGRGVCEHTGVSTEDVDIMMGTFTKSFGSVGGYIAGSQELIDTLRAATASSCFAASMSPACVQQIISALAILQGKDGTDLGKQKIKQLHENANMFRTRLQAMGCHVLGDPDSPVVPMMLYNPTKIAAFSREMLKRNVAVVVVGFPATPLLLSRVRFCLSAAHSKKDLESALEAIEEVCSSCVLFYRRETLENLLSTR
eukprot:c190_g1_i1.p1 GENE.c190_g1_i1~~c190_g1_i1.p1  ORF type:complete len:484 (+),score=114.07 c190_g1_i1:80-1531(+)